MNWKYKRGDLVRFDHKGIKIDRKVKHVLPDEDNRPLYLLEQYETLFRECDLELVVRADSADFVEITQAEYESLQADSRKLDAVRVELEGMIGEQEGNTFYYEDKFGEDLARVKYPAPFFMLEELRSLMAILEGNANE